MKETDPISRIENNSYRKIMLNTVLKKKTGNFTWDVNYRSVYVELQTLVLVMIGRQEPPGKLTQRGRKIPLRREQNKVIKK